VIYLKTGLVIIHYNDLESVTHLVKNVSNYKMIDRIVVVDNNSRKEIKSELKKLVTKKIKLIENKKIEVFLMQLMLGVAN